MSNKHPRRYLYPEFIPWEGMLGRCYTKSDVAYHRYGGRGIKVCARWRMSFDNFRKDMGPRPSKKHSIDRINNDGNYEPGNCRWATMAEQHRNKRNSVLLTIDGQTKTVHEWGREYFLSPSTVAARMRSGMSPRDCVNKPSRSAAVQRRKMAEQVKNKERAGQLEVEIT